MTSRYLADIAIRHQAYLEGLKASEAASFNETMSDLDKAVVTALNRVASGEMGSLSRAQANRLIRDLQDAHKEILTGKMDAFAERLQRIAEYEAEFESRTLQQIVVGAAALALLRKRARAMSSAALWRAIRQTPALDGAPLAVVLGNVVQRDVTAIGNLLRKAHAEGWTTAQVLAGYRGTAATQYRNGVAGQSARAHVSVVNTAIQHVSSVAKLATWQANDDIVAGYEWVSVLDTRTTSECRSLDGRIFEFGNGPMPPLHYNCRSIIVPVIRDTVQTITDDLFDETPTYYQWLARQTSEFQDATLGPVRAKLFRDGGLSSEAFARLSLSATFRPLTLAEMKRLQPSAFKRAGI